VKIKLRKKVNDTSSPDEFRENPFALGSYVNHSIKNANVVPFSYDFQVQNHLRCYIPNIPFRESDEDDLPVKSIVLVATKVIQDEEIFLNYKFNTQDSSKLPPWYSAST